MKLSTKIFSSLFWQSAMGQSAMEEYKNRNEDNPVYTQKQQKIFILDLLDTVFVSNIH